MSKEQTLIEEELKEFSSLKYNGELKWNNIDIVQFTEQLLTKEKEQREELIKEAVIKHSVELAKILISNPFETSGKKPSELVDEYYNKVIKPNQ